MRLSRRTFTKLSLLSSGAVIVPGVGSTAWALATPVALTDEERALFSKFAEAMLPTEGTSLKPRGDVPVVENVAKALALMDDATRDEVRTAVKLFDLGAVVIGFHFSRFANLGVDQRLDYIRRWEDGFALQRGIVDVLKKLTVVSYWSDIEAAREIDYVGPVSEARGIPRLGNAPMPDEEKVL